MKHHAKVISIAILTTASCSLSATELYNLDFTTDDVGSYETIFGNPSIQASVGPFANALVFHAVTGYDQIELPIGVTGPSYDIQFDVLVHNLLNSQYAFSMYLDTAFATSVDFHGGQNSIDVFQSSPYTTENLADFENDQSYHFDISVNLQANLWSVAIDGTQLFSNPVNASSLDDIRFSMAPWYFGAADAPTVYAGLDNVLVSVVPEPSIYSLLIMAGAAGLFLLRQKALIILCLLTSRRSQPPLALAVPL
ncbi:MAG TPA: PEP-CTERM sorting domain-containing protein [Verrucomicrobiae bacterium]